MHLDQFAIFTSGIEVSKATGVVGSVKGWEEAGGAIMVAKEMNENASKGTPPKNAGKTGGTKIAGPA